MCQTAASAITNRNVPNSPAERLGGSYLKRKMRVFIPFRRTFLTTGERSSRLDPKSWPKRSRLYKY